MNILFEHRFWLQILCDNMRFIHDLLPQNENYKIIEVNKFEKKFENLLYQAKQELTPTEIDDLTILADKSTLDLSDFITKQIVSDKILQPTDFLYYNVSELEEYIFILNEIMLNHDQNILINHGSDYAYSISSTLESTEKLFISELNELKYFSKIFDDFYLKALEFTSEKLGQSLNIAISKIFQISDKEIGTLMPLIIDHMKRKECYYLTKVVTVSKMKEIELWISTFCAWCEINNYWIVFIFIKLSKFRKNKSVYWYFECNTIVIELHSH